MKKISLIIIFFSLIFTEAGGLFSPGLAAAQTSGSVQAEGTPLPATVRITDNSVASNFPDNIRFNFKAVTLQGAPLFNRIELSYLLEGNVATGVRSASLDKAGEGGLSSSFILDTQKYYIPPGTRIQYYWTLYDEKGSSYNLSKQQLVYNDTRFKFQELRSGVVTMRWYQGDLKFGQAALNKANSTIQKLGQLYHLEPKTPINVTIYPDVRTMFTALPPNTAEWVGGQAIPALGTIVLQITPGNLNEIGRSLPHEISHQVVYQATRNPYNYPPKWLDEGLAVNNQDQVEGVLLQAYEKGVDQHKLYPLRVLNGDFPAESEASYLAYAQSVKVVQFIIARYGQEAIANILASFKDGVTYDEALQAGIGKGLDDLDREWKLSIGYPAPLAVAAEETTSSAPTAPTAQPTPENSPSFTLDPSGTVSQPTKKLGSEQDKASPTPEISSPAARESKGSYGGPQGLENTCSVGQSGCSPLTPEARSASTSPVPGQKGSFSTPDNTFTVKAFGIAVLFVLAGSGVFWMFRRKRR